MPGGNGRRDVVRTMLLGFVVLLAVACSASAAEPTVVPTFPGPTTEAGAAATTDPDDGAVPDDCGRLLPVADLGALLGLPLDSVTVRTTLGVPEESVGRTERVACRYSGGARGGSGTLLDLNSAAYTDAAAAAKQWRVNADAEDGDRREIAIGSASAVLVERRADAVLMVVLGRSTLTFVLPAGRLPADRPRGDLLVDLALRVLPVLATNAGPPPAPGASKTATTSS